MATKKITLNELRNLVKQTINEISPDTFKRAINLSMDRGTDRRTEKMGRAFFYQFIGRPLLGGEIEDIEIFASSGHRYMGRLVSIKIKYHDKNNDYLVSDPNHLKMGFLLYDIDKDIFFEKRHESLDFIIDRKDAVTLSKIAQKINPNTKYREVGKSFNINW